MNSKLPPVLAGPILRRVTANSVVLWLACDAPYQIDIDLFRGDDACRTEMTVQSIPLGRHLYLYLIELTSESLFSEGEVLRYQIALKDAASNEVVPNDWLTSLLYPGETCLSFVFRQKVSKLLHGSCRKPHFQKEQSNTEDAGDGLSVADQYLEDHAMAEWPALLMMSGDQVYADDVAGPMLHAIHQVIRRLGLPDEDLPGTDLQDSTALHGSQAHYYHRQDILPHTKLAMDLREQFFGGVRKPVFTSTSAHNHLMTFSEMIAMYLLVWSPVLWQEVSLACPVLLHRQEDKDQYHKELQAITAFLPNLSKARRVMAHLPTAMIFDDHDVTDDWNLTAGWEKSAYEHPLSRRIIGNALCAYFLCQAWGNAPEKFPESWLQQAVQDKDLIDTHRHDQWIDQLLTFDQWHYQWDTQPALLVLDTRTHRWRSEKSLNRPSGLMDWEAITDLQQNLLHHKAVILVSPAPMFGVKLIEAVQQLFTWIGKPLMVDAENWMAHPGSAHAMLNLFRHPKTPEHFVILSGDVHYSFVYDIELRGHRSSPHIWQITSSGLRNEFPRRLLDWFDRLNRWLYAPWSPFNWFTKRRGMWIAPRKPESAARGERLVNQSGIGLIELDENGAPKRIAQLTGGQAVYFDKNQAERRYE